jgi:hypothetical protein
MRIQELGRAHVTRDRPIRWLYGYNTFSAVLPGASPPQVSAPSDRRTSSLRRRMRPPALRMTAVAPLADRRARSGRTDVVLVFEPGDDTARHGGRECICPPITE